MVLYTAVIYLRKTGFIYFFFFLSSTPLADDYEAKPKFLYNINNSSFFFLSTFSLFNGMIHANRCIQNYIYYDAGHKWSAFNYLYVKCIICIYSYTLCTTLMKKTRARDIISLRKKTKQKSCYRRPTDWLLVLCKCVYIYIATLDHYTIY